MKRRRRQQFPSPARLTNHRWNTRQTQIPKDYYKEYFAITEPMFIKPREFRILNVVGENLTYKG